MSGEFVPEPQPTTALTPPAPPMGMPPTTPPTRPRSGFGAAGLVLGIVAVVLAFIPGALYVGFVLGALALVFGIVALRRGVGKGIPATVLGSLGVIIAVAFAGVYGGGSSVAPETKPVQAAAASSASAQSKPSVPNVVGMTVLEAEGALGDAGLVWDAQGADGEQTVTEQSPTAGTAVDHNATVTLTAQEPVGTAASNPAPVGTKFDMTSTNRLDGSKADYQEWVDSYNDNFVPSNEFEQADAGKKFVVVSVHVTASTAGVTASSVGYDLALSDPAGAVYDATTYLDGLTGMPSVTLGAGQAADGQIAFEVPVDFHGGIVSFGGGTVFEKTS